MENTQVEISGEDMETIPQENQTVSGGDYISMEELVTLLAEKESTLSTQETTQTIWEKPIEEYTPTEGLLLIIVVLLLWTVVEKFIGGIFK